MSGIETAFTGRLGGAPQLRQTSKSKAWASFSVAVGAGDECEWVSVAVFEPLVDELPPDLTKGERIYIEGRLRLNKWEGPDGLRATLQVAANTVVVLDRIGRRRKRMRNKAGDDTTQDTDTTQETDTEAEQQMSPSGTEQLATNGRMAGDEIPF